jgi:hypothetical protein
MQFGGGEESYIMRGAGEELALSSAYPLHTVTRYIARVAQS